MSNDNFSIKADELLKNLAQPDDFESFYLLLHGVQENFKKTEMDAAYREYCKHIRKCLKNILDEKANVYDLIEGFNYSAIEFVVLKKKLASNQKSKNFFEGLEILRLNKSDDLVSKSQGICRVITKLDRATLALDINQKISLLEEKIKNNFPAILESLIKDNYIKAEEKYKLFKNEKELEVCREEWLERKHFAIYEFYKKNKAKVNRIINSKQLLISENDDFDFDLQKTCASPEELTEPTLWYSAVLTSYFIFLKNLEEGWGEIKKRLVGESVLSSFVMNHRGDCLYENFWILEKYLYKPLKPSIFDEIKNYLLAMKNGRSCMVFGQMSRILLYGFGDYFVSCQWQNAALCKIIKEKLDQQATVEQKSEAGFAKNYIEKGQSNESESEETDAEVKGRQRIMQFSDSLQAFFKENKHEGSSEGLRIDENEFAQFNIVRNLNK